MKVNRSKSIIKRSESAVLSPNDLKLLKEMGFRRTLAHEHMVDLLNNKLRMRQLDQLKMLFFRINFMEIDLFPQDLKERILKNDLSAYSEAIEALFLKMPPKKRERVAKGAP